MRNNWKETIVKTLNKRLTGDWVKRQSAYEQDLCRELNWKDNENRYFDAICDGIKIEIKKGTSIWLDLRRYAETVKKQGPETITVFFIPNRTKDCIKTIFIVNTNKIIDWLKINRKTADKILNIQVPHSLNMQASIPIKEVQGIADVELNFPQTP